VSIGEAQRVKIKYLICIVVPVRRRVTASNDGRRGTERFVRLTAEKHR
jgi:hypothetical protein